MRLPFSALFACIIGFASIAAASASQQPPDAAPSTPVDVAALPAFEPTREEAVLEAFVDGVVAAHMRAHGAPGVTVSVVRGGKLLFAKGYGAADAAGARPASGDQTLFRIGSVSKTFIWTAVMMLHERGQIDLDADVNDYLKNVQIPDAFDAPVSMNDLMAHRAGFEDAFGVYTMRDGDETSLAEALNEHMPKRVFPPGARTSYSNWGAALAAQIVEDISGVPYEEFLKREMLDPLGMADTTLRGPRTMPDALRAGLAHATKIEDGRPRDAAFMEIGPFAPAGAMASTARDMGVWMRLHLGEGVVDGVRLMSPATHALLRRRQFDDRASGADLAHGFMARPYRGVETYGHGGVTTGFFTEMTLIPELDLGVFISQNAPADRGLVRDLAALVIDRLSGDAAGAPPAPAPEGTAAAVSEFAGQYINNRRSFTRFEKLFAAADLVQVAPTADGALVAAHAGRVMHFTALAGAPDTFENRRGERIIFVRNEKGAVTHMAGPEGVHTYERAGLFSNAAFFNAALGLAFLFSVTTWAGAWRRQGQAGRQTALAGWIGRGSFAAAGLVFLLIGVLIALLVQLSTGSASDFLDYPPMLVTLFRGLGLVLFAAAVLLLAGAPLVWRGSGWSIWRKAHYTLFTLALAAFAMMLAGWRVIFSATA